LSIDLVDPHITSHKYITFGQEKEIPKYCDPIGDSLDLNGWSIYRGIDQDGRIEISAEKRFGEMKYDAFENARIEIKVKSTKYKVPQIKAIKENDCQGTVKYVEVPDSKARMSSSLEQDRFIERRYRESSILTVREYLSEIFPEFDQLTSIAKLNEITAKIKAEMGNIQRDHEKYKVAK
jgi:hypothetical protein